MTTSSLIELGWTSELAQHFTSTAPEGCVPARVGRVERAGLTVFTESGVRTATLAGRLFHRSEYSIAVGDWVVLEGTAGGTDENAARVIDILPRTSALTRADTGGAAVEQTIAANVDVVFVVASLAAPLRPGRIERYLGLVWTSGAEPVLVLNKADACADLDVALQAASRLATGVRVYAVSAQDGTGIDALAAECAGNRTCALVGPSGVGKSTITNRLAGVDAAATGAVRGDGKGRHTTTWRELVPLPGGGALLDTPGLRGLALWDGGDAVDDTFADITALFQDCRFADCGHRTEPGCAVLAAIGNGTIEAARMQRYRKMLREQAYQEERRDTRARAERNARGRADARRRTREMRARRR